MALPRRHTPPRLLGVLALLALGCSEELGPERMPTAAVSGRVRVRNRPVGGGWIEFRPVEGTVGLARSAKLDPAGAFHADRVPVGRVAIRLVHPPFPLPCGRLFEQISVIRRDIAPAANPPIDLDLDRESLRHCPDR